MLTGVDCSSLGADCVSLEFIGVDWSWLWLIGTYLCLLRFIGVDWG